MIHEAVEHAVEILDRTPIVTPRKSQMDREPRPRTKEPLTIVQNNRFLQLQQLLSSGDTTAVEVAERSQKRARQWPGIVTDHEEVAPITMELARSTDRKRGNRDRLGILAGIPVTVKDNIDVAGLVSGQGGSLGRHRAKVDSFVASMLQSEESLLIGHSSMPELAWGLTTPGCPNPWRAGLAVGGSSGGAAASVAAGISVLAIGTDTGGSIRIPAALCGIAGLRPTHGIPSMRGIAPLAPSLDTAGILGISSMECLLLHEILAQPGAQAPERISDIRVGVLTGWESQVTPAIVTAIENSCTALRSMGVQILQVTLANARVAPSIAYVLMMIESSRLWLARAERQASNIDPSVLEHLREGQRIDGPNGTYQRALSLAFQLRNEVNTMIRSQKLDALMTPVTSSAGILDDAGTLDINGTVVPTVDALFRYNALASVTGLPALSVPAGLDSHGLPVAIQLIGPAYHERTLALLGELIEQGPGNEVTMERDRLLPF